MLMLMLMMMMMIMSSVAPMRPVIPPEVVCLAGMFLGDPNIEPQEVAVWMSFGWCHLV